MDITGSDHFRNFAAIEVSLLSRSPLRSTHVGVDTNFLLKIVRYRARSLRQKDARTTFEECADAGIIIPYAPLVVVQEVESHFEEFSRRHDVPVPKLVTAWEEVRRRLKLFKAHRSGSAAAERLRARDPTDSPFVDVYEHLKLDVMFTTDPDWSVTGHRTMAWDEATALLNALRNYARAAGPQWTVQGLTVFSILSVGGIGYALWRAPLWVKLATAGATVGAGVAVAVSPKLRGWIGKQLVEKGAAARDFLADSKDFRIGLDRIVAGKKNLAPLEEKARALLATLVGSDDPGIHALRAVVAAGGDANERDVGTAMLISGWRNISQDRDAEVRAALAGRPELIEIKPALWSVLPDHRPVPVIEMPPAAITKKETGLTGAP